MFQVLESPTFYPTHEDFGEPFCEYVGRIFQDNPDLPMFKVVPPKGWKPRELPLPPTEKLFIQQPVKQQVFGERGVYRCLLVEQKNLNGQSFKELADQQEKYKPKKQYEGDPYFERAFWSQITLNSPLYGADTPQSMFDEKLTYGWNLRNLGDLLQQAGLPQVPGVTSPMTYFGMWKAMFCWHTEDYDLFSINFVHTGAPKIWYCISPKYRKKFEEVAATEFFEAHRSCQSFLRHKDILFSPSFLKSHNIPYTTAVQQPNEFIVLNIGAYHAGYNAGFNIAEAVNFALPTWIRAGKLCKLCNCRKDTVQIDMNMFQDLSNSEYSSSDIYHPNNSQSEVEEQSKHIKNTSKHRDKVLNQNFSVKIKKGLNNSFNKVNIKGSQQNILRAEKRGRNKKLTPIQAQKEELNNLQIQDQQLYPVQQQTPRTGLRLKFRTTNLNQQMQNTSDLKNDQSSQYINYFQNNMFSSNVNSSNNNNNFNNNNSSNHSNISQNTNISEKQYSKKRDSNKDKDLHNKYTQNTQNNNSLLGLQYNHIGYYQQQQVLKPKKLYQRHYHVITRSRTNLAVGKGVQKRHGLMHKGLNQKT